MSRDRVAMDVRSSAYAAASDGAPAAGYTASGAPVLSVAPMMDWTDRHFRYVFRKISRHSLLYTEMITAAAIIHGDRDRLLVFDPSEHPISLQLGGDDPDAIGRAITIASDYGYDEFNLNVGCPSDRVQNGHFGACLMADPGRVAGIVRSMREATDRPVTVKHRIGIDGRERYDQMVEFVDTVAAAGIRRFTVHARIAILSGLNPKQNRSVPPLRYDDVYRLKRERPELEIEINGHVTSLDETRRHLDRVDAVMIGRAAYEDPWAFSASDSALFSGETPNITRESVTRDLFAYLDSVEADGQPPRRLINHLFGLFAGRPGARSWRRTLSEARPHETGRQILERALSTVPREIREEGPRLDGERATPSIKG